MTKVPVKFCFKGNRDYVHGTDIYKKIIDILSKEYNLSIVSNFRLFIHRFAKNNCYMFLGKVDDNEPPQEYVANFSYKIDNTIFKGYIIEESEIIECRYPYDEEQITKLCCVDGKKVYLLEKSPNSFIETVVAMTKHLHYICYPTSAKWVFTRLDLTEILNKEGDYIHIDLIQNLNNLLTKAEITCNNKVVGKIYFSLVVEE